MTTYLIHDLDGTLYSFSKTGIGKQMRQRINEFLCYDFKIPIEEADIMADHYYQKYGLTARGIQIEQKVSKAVLLRYCAYVHMMDYELISERFSAELVQEYDTMSKLPNTELWIMTNATKQHTAATLAHLGISNSFRCPKNGTLRVVDCFQQWDQSPQHTAECKPLKCSYEYMMKVVGAKPGDRLVMLEDSLRNLDAPKLLGWHTVFIADGRKELAEQAKAHGHDVVVDDIMDVIPQLKIWATTATATTTTASAATATEEKKE